MTLNETPTRVRPRSGSAGYAFAVVANITMLVVVNVWPGWDAAPFLTEDAQLVLPVVNATIAVNAVANLVFLVRDPAWLKSLGDIVTLGVGALALVRIWQVFPFVLGATPLDWALIVRIVLAAGVIGSCIGLVVALVRFIRSLLAVCGHGMHEVQVGPIPLERLAAILSADRAERLGENAARARAAFGDRVVWHVSATAHGGGVAEMLQSSLAYGNGAQIENRWLVLDGDPEFFAITKRVHNMLHGDGGDNGPLGEDPAHALQAGSRRQPPADAVPHSAGRHRLAA